MRRLPCGIGLPREKNPCEQTITLWFQSEHNYSQAPQVAQWYSGFTYDSRLVTADVSWLCCGRCPDARRRRICRRRGMVASRAGHIRRHPASLTPGVAHARHCAPGPAALPCRDGGAVRWKVIRAPRPARYIPFCPVSDAGWRSACSIGVAIAARIEHTLFRRGSAARHIRYVRADTNQLTERSPTGACCWRVFYLEVTWTTPARCRAAPAGLGELPYEHRRLHEAGA
jgi:hypothetical protein